MRSRQPRTGLFAAFFITDPSSENAPFCEFVIQRVTHANYRRKDCRHTKHFDMRRLETCFGGNCAFDGEIYDERDNAGRQKSKGLHPVPALRGNTLFVHPLPCMLQRIVSRQLYCKPHRTAVEQTRKRHVRGAENVSDIRFLHDHDPFRSVR